MTFPTTPASFITIDPTNYKVSIATSNFVSHVGTHNIDVRYHNGNGDVTDLVRQVEVTKDCTDSALTWVWDTANNEFFV